MADDLKPCPFCGGEASAEGYQKWSKPAPDTTWDNGDPITEAYFCNCPTCAISNITGGIGYRTREKAIAAWNRRATPTVQEAAKVLLAGVPNPIFDDLKHVLMGEFRQGFVTVDEDGNEVATTIPISWDVTKQIIRSALAAIAGESHD